MCGQDGTFLFYLVLDRYITWAPYNTAAGIVDPFSTVCSYDIENSIVVLHEAEML